MAKGAPEENPKYLKGPFQNPPFTEPLPRARLPNMVDLTYLKSMLMMRRLSAAMCPLCREIVPDPLLSQATFSHRYDPHSYHRCVSRLGALQGAPE